MGVRRNNGEEWNTPDLANNGPLFKNPSIDVRMNGNGKQLVLLLLWQESVRRSTSGAGLMKQPYPVVYLQRHLNRQF